MTQRAAEAGKKDDGGKPRWDLLPPDAMDELVRLYTAGADKYGEYNWAKGMSWSRVFAAMMRHAWSFWRGENLDTDPVGAKQHHMASVAWCALTLLAYTLRKAGTDDRPVLTKRDPTPAEEALLNKQTLALLRSGG